MATADYTHEERLRQLESMATKAQQMLERLARVAELQEQRITNLEKECLQPSGRRGA